MVTIRDLGEYTFPALYNNAIKSFSDCNALSFVDGKPITYAQVAERVENMTKILYGLNIREGAKVAIWSGSDPNWGVSYLALVNLGVIAVPILPDFSVEEVETILRHAGVSGIIISEKMYSKIKHLDSALLPFIIKLEDFSLYRNNEDFEIPQDYKAVLFSGEIPAATVTEDTIASIIYTSGTTGRSKGVVLTHKNIVFNAIQCQTVHRINKRDKCLSFLPLSHVYEFTIGFVMQFLNGACIYYLGKPPTVSTLLPAFKKIRPTLILSVPIIMEKIYKNKIIPTFSKTKTMKKLYQIRFFQKIFHRIAGKSLKRTFGGHLKFFGIGGAKVDTQVEQFMKDAKFPYAIGYGLTETAPLLAGSGTKNTKPGTIGPILEGVELQIINPNPETGIGEVVARGPNVMQGYYNDPELTAEVFTTDEDSCGAGWFKTGDLGDFAVKGYLSLKGRLKNMILGSGGENIYPEDIEFVLNQHPDVLESLVVEDEKGLVALVQLDLEKLAKQFKGAVDDMKEAVLYKQEEVLSEIKFYVNQKTSKTSKIGIVKSVSEFEKTASQKIKRYLYGKKNSSN